MNFTCEGEHGRDVIGRDKNKPASLKDAPTRTINPAEQIGEMLIYNQLKIGPIPHFKAIYLASKSGWEKVSLISCHRHISLHSSAHPLPLGIYAGPCHYQLPHPTLKKTNKKNTLHYHFAESEHHTALHPA